MKKKLLSRRVIYFLLFIASLALVIFSYYAEYFMQLSPCLLCWFQRWCFILFCIFSLIAFLTARSWWFSSFLNTLLAILSAFGIFFSARQVWLQHQPQGQTFSCLPNADFLLKTLPAKKILAMAYTGTAECGKVHWRIWGLTMPEWALIIFIVFFIVCLWQFRRGK